MFISNKYLKKYNLVNSNFSLFFSFVVDQKFIRIFLVTTQTIKTIKKSRAKFHFPSFINVQ